MKEQTQQGCSKIGDLERKEERFTKNIKRARGKKGEGMNWMETHILFIVQPDPGDRNQKEELRLSRS